MQYKKFGENFQIIKKLVESTLKKKTYPKVSQIFVHKNHKFFDLGKKISDYI